ncbi:MAG: hypothetical protein IJV74_00250 [Clostridia bacterium]|nr:hypothetical protein [Oscillospiraceae bacterium]MBQ9732646.1 hypothetical protein [Clostridia bacterium]
MRLIDIEPFETEKGAESCRITRWFVGDGYSTQVVTHTRDIPTIDPASLRPKGEWITASFWKRRKGHHVQLVFKKCSLCNIRVKARWNNNFCPNCGADMRAGRVSRLYEEGGV